ncbi:5-oxoprolinase subunit PxpB [Lewinella sp. IMCC34183]|uniref:5-oxoprolinase subunit PxpB n=1 Tax=Lewinella sp. IMCC34183 TaxID=2248762 RepID=UPI001300AD1F|nr:5-oxoprolinase subunit PxpB [Lewinella sp. IMCC34183]
MRLPRHIRPFGPDGLLLEWEARIDPAISRGVHAFAAALRQQAGVRECVPGYASLLLTFDTGRTTAASLREYVYALRPSAAPTADGYLHRVPVVYGGGAGPDLDTVAEVTGCSPEEVVRHHGATDYLVYLLGYRPGFAFLGPTPPRLEVPRRTTPRVRVPPGSVGMAGRQTGVYPAGCAGGWQLIGRCPWPLLDPQGQPRFRAGDRVRFFPIEEEAFHHHQTSAPWPAR